MHTYIYIPPLKTITGGMSVLLQIALQLHKEAYPVSLVSNGEVASDLLADCPVSILQLGKVELYKGDRWIIPEGWPSILAPGLKAGASCAIYVQNWAFLHGLLPDSTRWSDLPIRMFSVSGPVSIFIKDTTSFNAPIVRPVIDDDLFYPHSKAAPTSMGNIRIAWMPRKNRHLALQIRKIFEAELSQTSSALPQWIAIEHLKRNEVADLLRSCDIFLSTGFPEGCPLPPLEAMACGCIIAGFTGMGGWDYMRQAMPHGWLPPFELRAVPWGPNGFFAADGDVWSANMALKLACKGILSGATREIQIAGYETASYYNWQNQKQEILTLWENEEFWEQRNI